jgi:tRNA-dihydrouridine synthase
MAQGARWAVEHGATVVDINMGCPVDKVTKKDGGSKLLTDVPRAVEIARRVIRELEACALSRDEWSRRLGPATLTGSGDRIPVPLTCKMRLCWHDEDFRAGRACSPDLAVALADAGVCGVTVHGRTTEMKFSGQVILSGIARVVEAVAGRIPVIGNGDVRSASDVAAMIQTTGCSGVMIGRGALSTPWLFRDAWALQTTGALPEPIPEPNRIAIVRRFFDLMRHQRDDHYAMFQIRRRISWFGKTLAEGRCRPLKEAVRLAAGPDDVYRALEEFAAGGLRSGEPVEQEA